MSSTKIKMEWLNAQDPRVFMDAPEIRGAFVDLNRRIKNTSQEEAETFYEKEAMYLKRVIHASYDPIKPENYLGRCTPFSLYSCFMDMAANGDILSFNTNDKLCYIEKRNYKAGQKDGQTQWEARARLIISPYGELAIRQDAGQIAYADPAIVVFDGDMFQIKSDDYGNTVVKWESKIPRTSKKIIGSWIKITRPGGSFICYYMLQEEIDRLAQYSARSNRGNANALYGTGENQSGIDLGFLKAKTLKHGLATFPKVKIRGTNSAIDDMATDEPDGLDYLAGGPQVREPERQPQQQHTAPFGPAEPFGGPAQMSGPVGDWDEPIPQGAGIILKPEEEETF